MEFSRYVTFGTLITHAKPGSCESFSSENELEKFLVNFHAGHPAFLTSLPSMQNGDTAVLKPSLSSSEMLI